MTNKRELLVSTDSIGVFGSPSDLEKSWGFLKSHPDFQGLEMVGWWHSLLLQYSFEKNGFPIKGVHGQIGPVDKHLGLQGKLMQSTLRSLLVSTPSLVGYFGKNTEYVLIHDTEASSISAHRAIITNAKNINALFIENIPHHNSVWEAGTRAHHLRYKGVNASAIFDIGHQLQIYSRRAISDAWEIVLGQLELELGVVDPAGQYLFAGIHLPIGIYDQGVIPIEELTRIQLKQLAEVLNTRKNLKVCIENQQGGIGKIKSTHTRLSEQRQRNEDIVARLIMAEVI